MARLTAAKSWSTPTLFGCSAINRPSPHAGSSRRSALDRIAQRVSDRDDVATTVVGELRPATEAVRDREETIGPTGVLVRRRLAQGIGLGDRLTEGVESITSRPTQRAREHGLRDERADHRIVERIDAAIGLRLPHDATLGIVFVGEEDDAAGIGDGRDAVVRVIRVAGAASGGIRDGPDPAGGVVVVPHDATDRVRDRYDAAAGVVGQRDAASGPVADARDPVLLEDLRARQGDRVAVTVGDRRRGPRGWRTPRSARIAERYRHGTAAERRSLQATR